MKKNITIFCAVLSAGLIHAGVVAAGLDQPDLRDPFSLPVERGFNVSGNSASVLLQGSGSGFLRSTKDVALPELRFRGFISGQGRQPAMALLEIAGDRVHMVKVGDEINIDPSKPRQAIRITGITRLSITVEAGTLGQMKVLR